MRNGTRYGKKTYLMVLPENSENDYVAFVFETGRAIKGIPVHFINAYKNDCDEWFLDKFIAYGDRKDITLELEGFFCKNPDGMIKKRYSCTALDNSINCEVLR